jgi:cytochrome b6-f complex iron-sulfur subunit
MEDNTEEIDSTQDNDSHEDHSQEIGSSPAAGASIDAWKDALSSRSTSVPEKTIVPSAQAHIIKPNVTRRTFVKGTFWTGFGVTLLGFVGIFLDFFWPRGIEKFAGPYPAGNVNDFKPGAPPIRFKAAQTWIVNLDPSDTSELGGEGKSGYLALWQKCPHLGCAVPWRGGFNFNGADGWFRCPCHGSTYTKAGKRVFGPAPRSMDTFALTVDAQGNLTVHTDQVTLGTDDNASRAKTLDELKEMT